MKSFKWMITCISMFVGILLLSTKYLTRPWNNASVKTRVQPATAQQDITDTGFPVPVIGLQPYLYY